MNDLETSLYRSLFHRDPPSSRNAAGEIPTPLTASSPLPLTQCAQSERGRKELSNSTGVAATLVTPENHDAGNGLHVPRAAWSAPMMQRASTGLVHRELSYAVVGAMIEVHRHLGPGQLEATYERALSKELAHREIPHATQVPLTAVYRGDPVGDFCADVIVDGKIIVELKSVVTIQYVHKLQVLSYLRASGLRLGLLVNFNVPVVTRAVHRIVA